MSIELRILSGTRAGQSESFEKSVIAVGRHPGSDLRFDATGDIDVSTRHAEIRGLDGRYMIYDRQSTNGTFVNGERVSLGGSRELRDGDVIAFGVHGPTAAVRISGDRSTPIGARATQLETPALGRPAQPGAPARRPTVERIAVAVREQTRGLRAAVGGAIVVLGGLAVAGYWIGHRDAAARDTEIEKLIAANQATTKELQSRVQSMGDTALGNELRRRNDSLLNAVRTARGGPQAAVAQHELQRSHQLQRQFSQMDFPAISAANDGAVVLIVSEIRGKPYEATGFCVTPSGAVVTNRHVVSDGGMTATRLAVKFANTAKWHRAHLTKMADGGDVDLALIQVDDPGTYPTVHAIANAVDTPVGGAIATLGFPLGTDLAMEGTGNDLVAKTSLTIGTVSKSVTDLLQIDSFASHGSSGSPVFDGHGHVVGVVWGGPPGAAGRIVYAVPAQRVAELVRGTR